jgi:CheY-like chemotaxis protein
LRYVVGSDIQFSSRLGAPGVRIQTDRNALEQLLVHLIITIRSAIAGEGGRVELRSEELVLRKQNQDRPGSYVSLVIEDNGPGIDVEIQEFLFEQNGLGDTSIQALVQRSGGVIELTSELGHGTRYLVYFPIVDVALGDRSAKSEQLDSAQVKILIVEDHQLVRMSIRYFLESAGYVVVEAQDAEEAVTAARQLNEIQLVITDFVIPGKLGTQLAQELASIRPDLRIIYMSAYPRDQLIAEGKLGPEMRSLHKPFTEEELLTAVREAL